MNFLSELQKQKAKLKKTETVVTNVDGQRYIVRNDCTVQQISSNYGFVVDTKPDNTPILITDYLYIGSQDCAATNVLETYNIRHVLSLGVSVPVPVDSIFVNCLDLPETDIKDVLKQSLSYIYKCVDAKENILVHCNAGVSRTAMVAIGYLMHYEKMHFEAAYDYVKAKRPAIQPNDGFRKQLKAIKSGELI